MNVTYTFQRSLNSQQRSPTNKIYEILRESYDYQKDHIFYESYETKNFEHHLIRFYLDECDQPARTRETMYKLQDLIEEYL